MGRYLIKRSSYSIVILFIVSIVVFLLSRLSGDPVLLMLSDLATPENVARLRAQLGLDQPLIVQYYRFLIGIFHGDLGDSLLYSMPVTEVIPERLGKSLVLAGASLGLAVLVGGPLGIAGAVWRNRGVDYITGSFVSVLQGMPVFWFGLLLMALFSVRLGWLPTSGFGGLQHLILPTITLAAYPLARISRLTRASLLEVLDQDYVRTARAKGLRERQVLLNHAVRNASIPVVTLIGLQIGALVGGAVITESVFAWPGLGKLILEAVLARDYPLVQGCVLLMAVIMVITNFAVDVLCAYLDPRISY